MFHAMAAAAAAAAALFPVVVYTECGFLLFIYLFFWLMILPSRRIRCTFFFFFFSLMDEQKKNARNMARTNNKNRSALWKISCNSLLSLSLAYSSLTLALVQCCVCCVLVPCPSLSRPSGRISFPAGCVSAFFFLH